MSDSNMNTVEAALEAGEIIAGINPRIHILTDPNDEHGARKVVVGLVGGEHGAEIRVLDDATKVLEEMAPGPRHRAGLARLTDEDSFIAFVARWGSDDTVIYADTAALGFTAVLDDHPAGEDGSRWQQHRAIYTCPRSAEWQEWSGRDGKPFTQTEFGDFLESRLEDLVAGESMPAPLDVLAVARQLHIRTTGEFRREINTTTGDHILVNKSQTDTGSTVIPRAFAIAIPVFDGGVRYQLEARVRLTFENGSPRFSFVLHRRKEVERLAFGAVRAKVAKETGRLVLAGVP